MSPCRSVQVDAFPRFAAGWRERLGLEVTPMDEQLGAVRGCDGWALEQFTLGSRRMCSSERG